MEEEKGSHFHCTAVTVAILHNQQGFPNHIAIVHIQIILDQSGKDENQLASLPMI